MKILFAVDLSEPSTIIRQVEDLVRRLQADLLVLHVNEPPPTAPVAPVDPMSGLMGFAPYSVYDPSVEENMERAEADAFRSFLSTHFTVPVRPATRQGDAADMIIKDANEEKADLIVLGKRHQSKLQRLLAGSVAGEVVRHATRPVLILPVVDEEPAE